MYTGAVVDAGPESAVTFNVVDAVDTASTLRLTKLMGVRLGFQGFPSGPRDHVMVRFASRASIFLACSLSSRACALCVSVSRVTNTSLSPPRPSDSMGSTSTSIPKVRFMLRSDCVDGNRPSSYTSVMSASGLARSWSWDKPVKVDRVTEGHDGYGEHEMKR